MVAIELSELGCHTEFRVRIDDGIDIVFHLVIVVVVIIE